MAFCVPKKPLQDLHEKRIQRCKAKNVPDKEVESADERTTYSSVVMFFSEALYSARSDIWGL
jgi:hypothetical protein